jgi:autotransporter-associated beta strand protein
MRAFRLARSGGFLFLIGVLFTGAGRLHAANPVGQNLSVEILSGTTTTQIVRPTVSDADEPYGLNLTLELVGANGGAQFGAVVVTDWGIAAKRQINYTPGASYTTGDTVTYRVKDAQNNYSPNYTITFTTAPNSLPYTREQNKIVITNTQTVLPLWGHDDDVYAGKQTLQVELLTGPSHGTASVSKSSYVPLLTYTSNADFTGDDTITYRIGDGLAWSPATTVRLRSRTLAQRGNATIALLVPTELYQSGQIKTEIDRLAADMSNEGFRPIIRLLESPKSAEQMYDLISAIYDEQTAAGHFLEGVTIFGDPLVYVEPPNQIFLKHLAFGTTTLDRSDLFISRIGIYGPLVNILGQAGAIRNCLDANHAYRTGKVRLPWRAMKADWDNPFGTSSTPQNAPSNHAWRPMWDRSVWDSSDTSLTDGDVLVWYSGSNGEHIAQGFGLGGQYQACFSHGAADPADPTVQVMPIHVAVKFACEAGVTVRYYPYGRSYNLIAAPTAGEPSPAKMTRLLSGDYWGAIYDHLTGNVDTSARLPLAINGDLTLPLLKTPSNALPSASFSTAYAYPDTATSVTATASDDTQPKSPHVPWLHSFEWYDQTTGTTKERWSFDAAHTGTNLDGGATFTFHNATPYDRSLVLRIQDDWGASKYVSHTILGRPHPTSLFNVNLGVSEPTTDHFGRTWWRNNSVLTTTTQGKNWGSSGTTTTLSTNAAISGTDEPAIYRTQLQISGSSTSLKWQFPLANGAWTVRLHFAAIDPAISAGQQLADIKIENSTRATALDVRATAGLNTAYTLDFPVTLSDGQIDLELATSSGATVKPALAAIQLMPAGHVEPVTGPLPVLTQLGSLGNTTAGTATTVSFTVTNQGDYPLTIASASFTGSSNVAATVLSTPAGPIAPGTSGNLSVSLTPTTAGTWATTLSLANNSLASNPLTVTLSGIAAANRFTSTPPASTLVDTAFGYTATVSPAASITAITLPGWLTLTDLGNGTAALTGTPGTAQLGSHVILLRSTDGPVTSDQAFTLIVLPPTGNTAPVFSATPGLDTLTGQAYSATISATDAEGHALTLSALTLPTWLTFTNSGNGSATLSGTPTADGSHALALAVTDGLATTNWSGTLTVTTAPSLTQKPASSIQATAATLSARLLSPGSSAATLTVFYGTNDGSTTPGSWTSQATATSSDGETFTAAITGLLPGTQYFFRFRATNNTAITWSGGSGTFSTVSETTTSWSGASSTVWKFSGNWETGFVPADNTSTHIALFNRASYTNQPKLEATNSVNGLRVGASSAVAVSLSGQTSALLNLGSGGITTNPGASSLTLESTVSVALASPQIWTHADDSTLTVNGPLDLGTHEVTLDINNGTNTQDRLSLAGAITGSGAIRKTGSARMVLSNNGGIHFSGGLIIEAGSVKLDRNLNNSTVTLASGAILGVGANSASIRGLIGPSGATARSYDNGGRTLTINTAADTRYLFGGNLVNQGTFSITKTGPGIQVLAGSSLAHAGNTTVNGGTLLINGNLSASATALVIVNATATLGGIGVLSRPIAVAANGTLSPGDNGIGNLTVASLALDPAATYLCELGSGNASDRLVATGNATLDGALFVSGNITPGTYRILTCAGVLTDNVLNITGLPPTHTGNIVISGGNVDLVISSTVQTPNAPANLTATMVSSTRIDLTWTDSSTNETGFRLDRKTGANGTWSQVATPAANASAFSDTGLAPGTEFLYRLRATNATGNSTYSNEASATTRTAFAQWAVDRGLPANTDPLGHSDADGLPDFLEYGLDLDPLLTSTAGTPALHYDTATPGGPWITFTYRRNKHAPALTHTVRSSPDLTKWTDVTIDGVNATSEVTDPDPDGDGSAELIQVRIKAPADGPYFLQLKIAQ